MGSRFEATKSISHCRVCLLKLPIGQVPISSPVMGVGRNQVKCFKTSLPSSCPKFPSVALAGVMTHCTEKKPLILLFYSYVGAFTSC